MNKKWMKAFLALLLAILLPLSAMADTQHTLYVVPGDLLASEQAIADLLAAAALRVTEGEKSGALTLLLNDQPIVTIGAAADTAGLYAGSELLGEDVLFLSWDDAFALLGELLNEMMQGSAADEEAIQALEAALTEAKNSLTAGVVNASVVNVPGAASFEESIAAVEAMFPDDPQMVVYIKGLIEKMSIEDGIFVDKEHDAADQKYRMVMDETDLIAICDTAYMRNTLIEALRMENPEASEAELNQAADDLLVEVKKLYEESGFEMIMEMYTLDKGTAIVGLDMSMQMSIEDENQRAEMNMMANYDRLTEEDGVSHQTSGKISVDGETIEVLIDFDRAQNGNGKGIAGLLVGGEEIVVLYQSENIAADTWVRKADLYLRSNASTILEPAASARPLIGVKITTETAPEETLASLENANAVNSTNILGMSAAEMNELVERVSLNATQVLYKALAEMPTSTLNLLMENTAE